MGKQSGSVSYSAYMIARLLNRITKYLYQPMKAGRPAPTSAGLPADGFKCAASRFFTQYNDDDCNCQKYSGEHYEYTGKRFFIYSHHMGNDYRRNNTANPADSGSPTGAESTDIGRILFGRI